MKIVSKYQCELCETIYDTEKEAKKCEKKHPEQIELTRLVYEEHRTEPAEVVLKWGKIPGISAIGAVYILNRLFIEEE